VKEFDFLEGRENCYQYCVEICSGVHLTRMLWSGLTLRLLMSYIYIYIYIYDISSLRVNTSAHCSWRKQVKG